MLRNKKVKETETSKRRKIIKKISKRWFETSGTYLFDSK